MNILQEISNKYQAEKSKQAHEKEFEQYLIQVVADGKLSDQEMAALDKQKADFGLDDQDLKKIRIEGYLAAFNAAKNSSGGLTAEEEAELNKIQQYFSIPDADILSTKQELAQLRLLYEISQGNMPSIQVANIFLTANERAYWSEPGSILEQRISHQWQGGNSGFNFHLAKGISYRIGKTKGQLIASTQNIVTSTGNLIITSKRIIFSGSSQSFAVPLNKLIDVHFYSDGIGFTQQGRIKPWIIQFNQSGFNLQIIGAILQYATTHFEI